MEREKINLSCDYISLLFIQINKNAEKQLNHQRDSNREKKKDRQMLHALDKRGTC